MKKVFLAILTMLYMTVSSGVAMEIHYCMGKKAGVDLYGFADDKCGKCGMTEKKNGCCFDDHKFYKLSDSHKNVTNDLRFNANETAVVTEYPFYNWQMTADDQTASVTDHSPPIDSGPSACILHCVFRL